MGHSAKFARPLSAIERLRDELIASVNVAHDAEFESLKTSLTEGSATYREIHHSFCTVCEQIEEAGISEPEALILTAYQSLHRKRAEYPQSSLASELEQLVKQSGKSIVITPTESAQLEQLSNLTIQINALQLLYVRQALGIANPEGSIVNIYDELRASLCVIWGNNTDIVDQKLAQFSASNNSLNLGHEADLFYSQKAKKYEAVVNNIVLQPRWGVRREWLKEKVVSDYLSCLSRHVLTTEKQSSRGFWSRMLSSEDSSELQKARDAAKQYIRYDVSGLEKAVTCALQEAVNSQFGRVQSSHTL